MEEGGTRQGTQVALKAKEGKRFSPIVSRKECSSADTSILAQ